MFSVHLAGQTALGEGVQGSLVSCSLVSTHTCRAAAARMLCVGAHHSTG